MDGTYRCAYRGVHAGEYELHVQAYESAAGQGTATAATGTATAATATATLTRPCPSSPCNTHKQIGNRPIHGSPFATSILPAYLDTTTTSKASGHGLKNAVAGEAAVFQLYPRDHNGRYTEQQPQQPAKQPSQAKLQPKPRSHTAPAAHLSPLPSPSPPRRPFNAADEVSSISVRVIHRETSSQAQVWLRSGADGALDIYYRSFHSGPHDVWVMLRPALPGCPHHLSVRPSPVCPTACTVEGMHVLTPTTASPPTNHPTPHGSHIDDEPLASILAPPLTTATKPSSMEVEVPAGQAVSCELTVRDSFGNARPPMSAHLTAEMRREGKAKQKHQQRSPALLPYPSADLPPLSCLPDTHTQATTSRPK